MPDMGKNNIGIPEGTDPEDSWMKNFWRPLMAVQYCLVCVFDFIVAPLLTGIYAYATHTTYLQWDPLTLKATGFYHVAMAAILGVASWTRGQEKIKQIELNSQQFEERLRLASVERTKLAERINTLTPTSVNEYKEG